MMDDDDAMQCESVDSYYAASIADTLYDFQASNNIYELFEPGNVCNVKCIIDF